MQAVLDHQKENPELHSPWQASLELEFAATQHGTILCKNVHQGPLLVQKPLYPESRQICHVYLIHPPGGVVHGDQLNLDVTIAPSAHALITTPAAGKFYRSHGRFADLTQVVHLQEDAKLEWLPQETLLYDQSLVRLKTIINLNANARFIGWEMLCLGRIASASPYQQGQCFQNFEIWRDGLPLFLERSHIEGDSAMLTSRWGMNHLPLTATFIATHCSQSELTAVHDLIEQQVENQGNRPLSSNHFSATLKGDALICRFLGSQAEHARQFFIQVWQIVRPVVMEHKVHVPRIWNT